MTKSNMWREPSVTIANSVEEPLLPSLSEEEIEAARTEAPPVHALLTQDRLTARLDVTHESYNQQAVAHGSRFSEMLLSREQPYQRRIRLNKTINLFNKSWIDQSEAGLVVIENVVESFPQRNPTEEELEEIASGVVLLKVSGYTVARVSPGKFTVIEPDHQVGIDMSPATDKELLVNLTIFPE
jgi:hypothetical protein